MINSDGNAKSSGWISVMRARPFYLLALLILPVLLLPTAFSIRNANGPFWFSINLDPNYPYLMNSLNISNLRRPYKMEAHPGVPVQVIGGATIRLLNPRGSQAARAAEVATNSEFYLNSISDIFIFLASVTMIFAGFAVFRLTNNIFASLFLQFTPWLSVSTMEGLFGVRPEPILISVSLLFSVLVLRTLRGDITKFAFRYCIAFGLLSGLGMACKINFLPVLVVPLFLFESWRTRLMYLAATAGFFLIFILPILTPGHLQNMLGFALNMTTRKGPYGSGAVGFLSPLRLLANAQVLLMTDWLFFVIVLVAAGALALRVAGLTGARRRILIAVTVGELLQIAMVVRQPESRYLIPALGLIGVNLVILFEVFRNGTWLAGRRARHLMVVFVAVLVLAFQSFGFRRLLGRLQASAENERTIHEKVENEFRNETVVEYYSTSSRSFALKFGSEYSGDLYAPVLAKIYPDKIFYNLWTSSFSRFSGPVDPNLALPGDFVMQGYDLSVMEFRKFLPGEAWPQNLALEPVYQSKVDVPGVFEEAIYRAKLKEATSAR